MAKRKASVIPINAVRLIKPPISRLGGPCDFDRDIDILGRIVVYTDGQWWGWYPK